MTRPPAISIITRTKDRPLFLARARESVAAQTRRDFEWIIVNDAGAPAPVDAVATAARAAGFDVQVLHRAHSTGMEAASNAGLAAARGALIALHDDDDSWAPVFLERMTAALEARPAAAGIVCWSREIRERVEGERIRVLSSRPYLHSPDSVTLARLAIRNQFPPIAFLYRRAAQLKAGSYDESLPVLGDWDFNIRMALEGEIAVLPDYLANYHVRSKATGAAANSIDSALAAHLEADALIRNRWLRADIAAGRPGMGRLMAEAVLAADAANAAAERASPLLRLKRLWRRLVR